MKSRFLTLIVSCVFLAGCKAEEKEITFEEVKTISQDILKRIESEDYKRPTKLTAVTTKKFYVTDDGEIITDKNSPSSTETLKEVIDEDAKYLYRYYESNSNEGKQVSEEWAYPISDDLYVVAEMTTQNEKTVKQYRELEMFPSFLIDFEKYESSDKLSYFADENLTKEEMEGAVASYKFTSSGKYNVTIEGFGKSDEYVKLVVENCLQVSYEQKLGQMSQNTSCNWGKAKISKPNLSEFKKIDVAN